MGADGPRFNRYRRRRTGRQTSHPPYSLLLLLTVPIPLSMWYFSRNEGDSTFYWRITGIVGLTIIAVMALARVLAWYVFRFGKRRLASVSPRIAWEIAWKPVLMLIVISYRDRLHCARCDVLATGSARCGAARRLADTKDHVGQTFRVEGRLASDPVYWAPNGTGRGGNNYA